MKYWNFFCHNVTFFLYNYDKILIIITYAFFLLRLQLHSCNIQTIFCRKEIDLVHRNESVTRLWEIMHDLILHVLQPALTDIFGCLGDSENKVWTLTYRHLLMWYSQLPNSGLNPAVMKQCCCPINQNVIEITRWLIAVSKRVYRQVSHHHDLISNINTAFSSVLPSAPVNSYHINASLCSPLSH